MIRGIDLFVKNNSIEEFEKAQEKLIKYEQIIESKFPPVFASFFKEYFPFRYSSNIKIGENTEVDEPNVYSLVTFCRIEGLFFANDFMCYTEKDYASYALNSSKVSSDEFEIDCFYLGEASGDHWTYAICLSGYYKDKILLIKLREMDDYSVYGEGQDPYLFNKKGIVILADNIYDFINHLIYGSFKMNRGIRQIDSTML